MDLTGKVVVVTGATSGLGQAAAIAFANDGARVFVVGRDAARAEETRVLCGANAEVVVGDVSTAPAAPPSPRPSTKRPTASTPC